MPLRRTTPGMTVESRAGLSLPVEARMEKQMSTLKAAIGLAAISGGLWVYLWFLGKRFTKQLDSVDWVLKHRWIVLALVVFPIRFVYAPALEELVYRGPLVALCHSMTLLAWVLTTVSATLFAIIHWKGPKLVPGELDAYVERRRAKSAVPVNAASSDERGTADTTIASGGENVTDDLAETVKETVQAQSPRTTRSRKIANVFGAFVLGMVCGYYSISDHSLWVAFRIHAIWNIVATEGISLIVLAVIFVIGGGYWLGGRIWDRTIYEAKLSLKYGRFSRRGRADRRREALRRQ